MMSFRARLPMRKVIDYINSVVGTPWVEGVTDCYWLVEDSYRVLDGVTLPTPPWRTCDSVDDSAREILAAGGWVECEEQEGAVFAVYDKSGCMCHVGRILAGLAVHSDGTRQSAGQCRAEPLKAMQARYGRLGYTLRYYRYGDN